MRLSFLNGGFEGGGGREFPSMREVGSGRVYRVFKEGTKLHEPHRKCDGRQSEACPEGCESASSRSGKTAAQRTAGSVSLLGRRRGPGRAGPCKRQPGRQVSTSVLMAHKHFDLSMGGKKKPKLGSLRDAGAPKVRSHSPQHRKEPLHQWSTCLRGIDHVSGVDERDD